MDNGKAKFLALLRQESREFADAVEHVASACRGRLLAVGRSLTDGNLIEASSGIDSLSQSQEIRAVGASMAGRGLDLAGLGDRLGEAGGPLAKIVIGLTSVAAGGLAGAAIAALVGVSAAPAVCLLLIVGGLILALMGLSDLIHAAAKRASLDMP